MPDSQGTARVRAGIDKKGKELKKIIAKIQGFDLYDAAVKTAPRGYKKDNPNIALLKLKHWILESEISDKELMSGEFEKDVMRDCKKLAPFVEWLQERVSEPVG